ncbi:MAG: arylesterase [Microcoleus vaginatus WJT46-NPBG5]|jgi:acyl-CoA thioesterase-1|nr:arylesterase [Microcoleus vaginatus WJT46-NPBG5]
MRIRKWLSFLALTLSSLLLVVSCQSQTLDIKNLNLGTGTQIIVLGDSIASGYGVAPEAAFPSVLSRQLGVPIVNQGVSGNTTAMGLNRLQTDVIAGNPWLVIVELGGNDFLQKLPKPETEKNLREIVTSVQESGAIAVLLGIELGIYVDEYNELYERVAKDTKAYLIPQVTQGILDNPRYRQDDIIHPNQAGHQLLATRIAQQLKPLLEKATWPPPLLKFQDNIKKP